MNIYIFYRHYWPDITPYGTMLKQIAERLVTEGHEVTVFSAQPSYNDIKQKRSPNRETVGGVNIIRIPLLWEKKSLLSLRILNSIIFTLGAIFYGLTRPHIDLVMTHSAPPVFMGIAAWMIGSLKRIPYVYHCQDLNPEAILYGGKLKAGVVYKFIMFFEKKVQSRAAAVVVLSRDMLRTVRNRGLSGANVHIINNFALTLGEKKEQVPDKLQKKAGCYRVLFAGNHGSFQGLEEVIKAAWLLKSHEDICFQFLGEGAVKSTLKEMAGELTEKTIFFHSYVPVEIAFAVMKDSELGLVTLSPNVYKVAFPSKTMTLLEAGLPLLVAVEPESELNEFVRTNEVGWSCPAGDAQALANAILDAYEKRGSIQALRNNCKEVAKSQFGKDLMLRKWTSLVSSFNKKQRQ